MVKKKVPSTQSKLGKRRTTIKKKKENHQEYGTSKLEEKFASEFLDKLGIDYTYQYKAEDIGRYYDFAIPNQRVLIEIDGDYYHSKDLAFEDMNPMQKRNKMVDGIKDRWALVNGFVLLRIWESDINNNPKKVIEELKSRIKTQETKILLENKKNKRHINKLKDGKKDVDRGTKKGNSNLGGQQ